MKQTQLNRVISKLNHDGQITRNECLRQVPAITRLGAIIVLLERAGWNFEAGYSDDKKDYVYKTKTSPIKKIVYTLPDGKQVTNYARN